jgi:hypothetical protein
MKRVLEIFLHESASPPDRSRDLLILIALSVSSTTARSFVSIRLVAVPWALQKRSSEVWQLLGAIKTALDRYGTVVNTQGQSHFAPLCKRSTERSKELISLAPFVTNKAAI